MVNYFHKLGHTWQFKKSALEVISAFQGHFHTQLKRKRKQNQSFWLISNFHYTKTLLNSYGKSLTNIPLHYILDHSQFSVIIKYCQYNKLFLTQLFPFLSPSEQVAIFSHKPCRVGHLKAFFQPGLFSAGELTIGSGKLDYRTTQLALRTDFTHAGFSFWSDIFLMLHSYPCLPITQYITVQTQWGLQSKGALAAWHAQTKLVILFNHDSVKPQ